MRTPRNKHGDVLPPGFNEVNEKLTVSKTVPCAQCVHRACMAHDCFTAAAARAQAAASACALHCSCHCTAPSHPFDHAGIRRSM
jgi:hypothetical protein